MKLLVCAASCLFLYSPFLGAAEANTVVSTIGVGVTPGGIAVTPNSLFAYVANNNNYGIVGADTVSVINLTNNTVATTISDASFNGPYTVTINPAGTTAYVTNSNSNSVTVINVATNTVIHVITGFDGPSGMAISSDGTVGYVNNYGYSGGVGSGNGTTVRVVNLLTNTIVGLPITVGQAPAALAITPNGAFVYVINYVDGNPGHGTISVIQTSNNTVVATIPGFFGPFDIAITPNGKYAYVSNFGSNNFSPVGNTVSVVNLQSNTITATITLGVQPAGIAITPDGSFVYVSNYNTLYLGPNFTALTAGQGTVNIIDTQANQVISPTINVGLSPDGIAISPNGSYAYVTNYTSNTVSVIPTQPFQIVVQGCKTKTRYSTQTDMINKLTWSVSGTSLPVNYSIYRDAGLTDLAGTVGVAQPFVFADHNTRSNITYTYYITGTNAAGLTSYPVPVTVSQGCGRK